MRVVDSGLDSMFIAAATTSWYDTIMTATEHSTTMSSSYDSSFHQMAYMYGIQMIVLITLIAITIFRKEMSCNHCYAAQPPLSQRSTTTAKKRTVRSTSSSSSSSTSDEMDDLKTESLLEEAGCYGSGTYTLFLNTIRFLRRFLLFHPTSNHNNHAINNNNKYYYYSHPFLILHYHMWDSIALWWTVAAEERHLEDILDGADNWCVLGPHPLSSSSSSSSTSASSSVSTTNALQANICSSSSDSCNSTQLSSDTSCIFPTCTASQHLPIDVLVQIFSYLCPQDVISFACTNRNIHHTLLLPQHERDRDGCVHHDNVDIRDANHEFSHALWKTLWYRDYGWLVTHWDVGRMALERSLTQSSKEGQESTALLLDTIIFTPTFYFRFGMSYVNYIIAGHCNHNQCFIGLGGHIYDITKFVDRHPGSSETLLVHSGRDVSSIFETMRHTVSARIMAEQFCLVVDGSLLPGGVGARPTRHFFRQVGMSMSDDHKLNPVSTPTVSHRCHSNRPLPSTMEYMYDTFLEEQEIYERQAKILLDSFSPDVAVGDIHVYYDPMIGEWKGWYMNTNFESVFIEL